MAKYRITSPTGDSFEITAPDGATEEDVKAFAQQHFNTPKETPKSETQSKNAALINKLKNSPLGGIVRGLRDPIDAGAQMLESGLNRLGVDTNAINQAAGMPSADEAYKASELDYRDNWRNGEMQGLDGGRLVGNVAAAIPAGAAIMGGKVASTLPGLAGQGALVGGGTALMAPVDTEKTPDVLGEKLNQGVIGAALGAAAPVVLNTVVSTLAPMFSKVGQVFKPADAQNIASNITTELNKRGVDISRVSEETRQSLLTDVSKALQGGGALDFDALARKAAFDKLGIKPTEGQLTFSPAQVQFERNTAGISGVGDDLSNRYNEQNRQLVAALPTASDTMANGETVINALRTVDANNLSKATKLYDKALNSGGKDIPINGRTLKGHVDAELNKNLLQESLPGGIGSYINRVADQGLTLGDAQSKIHAINAGMSKIPDRSDRAAAIVKEKLRQHMAKAAQRSGSTAAADFRQADAAYRQRMQLHDKLPAMREAVDQAAPDDFIRKHVISGTAKARDVLMLRSQLRDKPEAWQAVKNEVGAHIRASATNGKADELAKFSPSGFDRALRNIGDAKLKAIFTREEYDTLKTLSKVANAIEHRPTGAVINNSGTSQALANLAQRVAGIPYLRELITPLNNYALSGKVQKAINPTGDAISDGVTKTISSASPVRIGQPLAAGAAAASYPLLEGVVKGDVNLYDEHN